MNIGNFLKLFIGYILICIIVSCESHEKKADDAFERVKEQRNDTSMKRVLSRQLPRRGLDTKQEIITVETQPIDEWTEFKLETEFKIKSNENKIHLLKRKKVSQAGRIKFNKQITKLELINNELRTRLNDYHEEVTMKWQKFKVGVNHDIDEIGIALKEIEIAN